MDGLDLRRFPPPGPKQCIHVMAVQSTANVQINDVRGPHENNENNEFLSVLACCLER